MFGPTRLWLGLRRHPDLGLLAGAIAVAVLFTATPFVIAPLATEFGVSVGSAGMLSTAQVGGFAASVFIAGRVLRTDRKYLLAGALIGSAANAVSAVVPGFLLLLVVRFIAGGAAGLFVWLAWASAMQTPAAMRDVAAAGPVAVLIGAPIMSMLAEHYGSAGVFLAIAVVMIPPAFLPARFSGFRPDRHSISPSRSNVVLIGALALVTLAGASLFVFAAAIAQERFAVDPLIVSLGFSVNALAGLVGARHPASDTLSSWWVLAIAASAAGVAFSSNAVVFFAALAAWGFTFWMATPNILRAIAAWSVFPDERVGDAQSAMAVGRALGPAVAAVLINDGSFTVLGIFSVSGLVIAGVVVAGVRRYRRTALPPAGTAAAAAA